MLVRTILLSAVVMGAAQLAAGAVEMAPPREYPTAGIALAVPKGFTFRSPADQSDVMFAVLMMDKTPAESVRLSVFVVGDDVTAKAFSAERVRQISSTLAVRNLKVIKETTMTVAGLAAVAQRLAYTFRGDPVQAAGVCFIRSLPGAGRKLCYLLTVECGQGHQDKLLPILGGVLKSISIIALRRPMQVPVGPAGPAVKCPRAGYEFAPPADWFVIRKGDDLIVSQSDYLRPDLGVNDLPLPQLRVMARRSPVGVDSKAAADRCCSRLFDIMKSRAGGIRAVLLSSGPAKLAGRDAYEFVVLQKPAAPTAAAPAAGVPTAAAPTAAVPTASRPAGTRPAGQAGQAGRQGKDSVIIAQRTLCVAGPSNVTAYSLVLVCPTSDGTLARRMLAQLAEGFRLLGEPQARPAGPAKPAAPAPSQTRPGQSRASSQPRRNNPPPAGG